MSESRNDRIREAVNKIEPAESARDRMLVNIKRKAAEQATGEDTYSIPALEKNMPLKRFVKWLIPIAACFVIVVVGTAVRQKTINTTNQLSATADVQHTSLFAGVDNTFELETVYTEPKDTSSQIEKTADLESLRAKYPEYFDLSTFKGLEVYVWQMGPNSYSCGVLPGTNREKTFEELMKLKGATIAEMRAILSTYDIDEEDVSIIPWQNPVSSYIAEYWISQKDEDPAVVEKRKQEYIDRIRQMLFGAEYSASVIDAASLDIDNDGVDEDCTMSYGPTSGLFTVVITASVDGRIKYKNTFNLPLSALTIASFSS